LSIAASERVPAGYQESSSAHALTERTQPAIPMSVWEGGGERLLWRDAAVEASANGDERKGEGAVMC
jgi:hypothetical protein